MDQVLERPANGQYIHGSIRIGTVFLTTTNFDLFCFLTYIPPGSWDAVVTCFFLDTAHNIVEYIEIISKILKDGGVWINLGPLLYDLADSYGEDEMSIELSLEDVKRVAFNYGFELEVKKMIETTFSANTRSLMQTRYFAAFWTMRKKIRKAKQYRLTSN